VQGYYLDVIIVTNSMERIDQVVYLLQEQGYSISNGNSEPGFLHMFKPTNPPDFYPRYHLLIPRSFDTGFDLLKVKIHFDSRRHKSNLTSDQSRTGTVSEIKGIIQSLQTSQIDQEAKHPLLVGLNNLLLFGSVEVIMKPTFKQETPYDKFIRHFGGYNPKHRKYERNSAWRDEIEE